MELAARRAAGPGARIVDGARSAASNIRVHTPARVDDAEVRVDRDLLKQAVLNVVVNAMQAMPGGGDLTFGTSPARK